MISIIIHIYRDTFYDAPTVGLGLIIIVAPLNGLIFHLLNVVRRKKVLVTDERVKLMNEILTGIRVIKFYAWEKAFSQKVEEIRMKELIYLKQLAYIFAVGFSLILMAVPLFMPVLIFYTYTRLGNDLTAAKAFTSISLFNLMQFPFVFLPLGLSQYSQSLVSCKRMMDFFCMEEMQPYVDKEGDPDSDVVISMNNVSMGWMREAKGDATGGVEAAAVVIAPAKSIEDKSQEEGRVVLVVGDAKGASVDEGDPQPIAYEARINRSVYTLTAINFSVKRGELVAVVGSVGSGKSSLLSGLLGEILLLEGKVRAAGTIAYCDQRPWIVNDSVKENIIFGRAYNEAAFDEALYAASLEDDIAVLPGGIQTQIGEKGINLSGGQKARVSLARAVYRDADIYLLDDPLSAVDAHVGQFLFHECIRTVLASKTRILVTHQVHLLPYCDKIIVMEDGRIRAMGSYEEILTEGVDVAKMAHAPVESTEEEEKPPAVDKDEEQKRGASARGRDEEWNKQRVLYRKKSTQTALARKLDTRSSTITSLEEKREGGVEWSLYGYYVKAGGIVRFTGLVIFVFVSQLFIILSLYWLSFWGGRSRQKENEGSSLTSSENLYYLQVFALLSVLSLICYTLRSLLLANHRLGTSWKLHRGLLKGTLGSPIGFFDSTPIGRILNRFSSDLLVIDEELSQTLSQASNSIGSVVGAIGAIAGATKGTFLIFFVPLLFIYNEIQKFFRATNTAVARLESVSRSPIYAGFSQVLSGISTVRAYRDSDRFVEELEAAVDSNSIANITQQLCSQWLAIRLDFLGAAVSFFVAVIAAATQGFIPAGYLALGLSYSFQLTQYLKFLVRMIATLESQMNAVERVRHYMTEIAKETDPDSPSERAAVPREWPHAGEIVAEAVDMSYGSGPLVLKGLSFHLHAKEKVGLVGRTGSGKSSIIAAMYRFQAIKAGKVTVDGVDTATIPLHELRSRLGIIPQDPVMFSATVRFNLDPFNLYSDLELWNVLAEVNMKEYVSSLPKKLEELVAEGGDNFSAGQRQVIS